MKMKSTVFLCHSKKDRELIVKIADDLRVCRINVWFDEWEIPAGAPFQRKIFNEGIPESDSFFIYLSEASIQSHWVQKELDAAFIQQHREGTSKIITFVDSTETRDKLSPDIAALQSPIINVEKYHEGFIKLLSAIHENQVYKTEKRFQNVYAPMRATLLSTHIAFTGRAGDRLTDADIAEVEYGRPFPFDEIVKIASENSAVADSKLLDMIQRVSRAKEENEICATNERYVNPKGGEVNPYILIPEERELVDYIREQYEFLLNKLGRNT